MVFNNRVVPEFMIRLPIFSGSSIFTLAVWGVYCMIYGAYEGYTHQTNEALSSAAQEAEALPPVTAAPVIGCKDIPRVVTWPCLLIRYPGNSSAILATVAF